MTQNIDEVRLTAHALGELDAAEAAEVEALLATDAAARAEVDKIRAFAGTLMADLAGEPAPEAFKKPAPRATRWSIRRWSVAAAAVFVAITVATVGPWSRGGGADSGARRDHGVPQLNMPMPALEASKQGRDEVQVHLSLVERDAKFKGLGDRSAKDGVPEKRMVARVRDFDIETAQGAVIADPIVDVVVVPDGEDPNSVESYSHFKENGFVRAIGDDARSTFALDVDTASYANVRRLLRQGVRPEKGAVRIEELINYFDYDYAGPKDKKPLAVAVEVGACPWAPSHRLALIGLKAKTIDRATRGRANLVFLIDVSGSMDEPNKLPLVKKSLGLLIEQLRGDDRVALVVYAGASGLVLPSTSAGEKAVIREAIDRLGAGGSTNGAQGIELAYQVARDAFVPGGINRVVLCTDGDFNVGITSESGLVELIENKAKTGVFLTVLGFGMGNLKDSTLQKLADKGNGNYGYIDTEAEAKKLLVNQVDATLVTVAKDARIQVEFNPAMVGAWRLIGYEKRVMPNRDFHDDTKDAGEVGAGHTVTALYEIIPAGSPDLEKLPKQDGLRYQGTVMPGTGLASADFVTVALRYKEPDGDTSSLVETPARDDAGPDRVPSRNFRFAAAVAMFGMELRGSEHKGHTNWALIDELAREAKGEDKTGLRAEFLELIGLARKIEAK